MNVTQDLVRGLKMNWGASYGDNMHFDLRTDGGKGEAIMTTAAHRWEGRREDHLVCPQGTPGSERARR